MEIPVDPRLHARLHRGRRGRPDAPAGRAPRLAARDPGPARVPARRRERGRRDLAVSWPRSSASRRSSSSRARRCRRSTARPSGAGVGRRPGRLRPRRCRGRRARRHPDRDRIGGRARARPRATSWPRDGIGARVVSMPCWELFDRQPQAYRDAVLPPSVQARVADRAGVDARLGPLRRRRRRDRRHAHVRRVGAAEDARREVRVHARRGGARSRASASRAARDTLKEEHA